MVLGSDRYGEIKEDVMGEHRLSDYDVWYKKCENCGYDTGKSTKASRDRCWKCGRRINRDYSDRALRPSPKK